MKEWFKVFFIFFVLGLLVYFNSLNNKFLLDDYFLLSNPVMSQSKFISSQWNPYLERGLGVLDNSKSFIAYYRPLAQIVYDFCYATFKNNYWQYHLLNLFLFVLASSLIYLFIEKVTGNYNLAFLVGLFFLIHPINGIIVNYIVSSVFAILLIFMMGTILLLWESLERKNNRPLYFLSLLFSFLSFFWYDMGTMTPIYLSAVILIFRKDLFKTKITYLLPYFLISFSCLFFRAFYLNGAPYLTDIVRFHMTRWEYLATVFRLIMWHITQLCYPRGIVMQWATPILHEHIFWYNLGLVSLLIFFILIFVRFAKEKICLLATAWILIGFAPVCLLAFKKPDVGALIEPHWFIFSSIGFFILAAYCFLIILDRAKKGGLVLLFIVIVAWGGASHAYNQIWADQKTYARFWSQQVPNLKLTYMYLADAYQREGAFKEARKYYRLALTDNSSANIYLNLAAMDSKIGDWKGVELSSKMALKIDPYSADPYNNLGIVYLQQGQWKKAKVYFLQALVYDPFMLDSRRGLAFIYKTHSEYQKAIDLCLKNLDIVNNDTGTLFLLIDIYSLQKDIVSLKKYAYRVINDETDPEILTRLGDTMSKMNISDVALDSYTKVFRVAPDYKDAYLATGILFAHFGKYEAAIHIWNIGSSIDPSDSRFKKDIAKVEELKLKKSI